jgi:hypothetical protein
MGVLFGCGVVVEEESEVGSSGPVPPGWRQHGHHASINQRRI